MRQSSRAVALGGEQLSRWLVFAALGRTRLKATSNAPAAIYLAPIVPNKSDYGQPMPSCCSARQLPANGGRTATKAASNFALAAAIRPRHHQRHPLLGCQMLTVGSHRNTLPERCGTWLLSRRIYFFGGRAVIGTAKCPWIFALIVGSRKIEADRSCRRSHANR